MKLKSTQFCIMLLIGLTLVFLVACDSRDAPPPKLEEVDLPKLTTPDKRSFLLGFTYQPYDWSPDAFEETVSFIYENSDFMMVTADDGVPWQAAYSKTPYSKEVEEDLTRKQNLIKPGQRVLLAVNFLGTDRRSLTKDLGDGNGKLGEDTARIGIWKDKNLGSPMVVEAYTNYCQDLVSRFKPFHLIYGLEVNWYFKDENDPEFLRFKSFCKQVYTRLKAQNPNLPISLEFTLANNKFMQERKNTMALTMPYSDTVCISTYPYVPEADETIVGDATKVPKDWFRKFKDMFPDRKFAVTETGFNSKLVKYWDRRIPGNPSSQNYYMRFLLEEANDLNFTMVNWWVHRDGDKLWEKLKAGGVNEAFGQWNSNGLLDAQGQKRPAYDTWKQWFLTKKK